MKVCKRPSDFVFRVGGEEFIILITGEDTENILSLSRLLTNGVKDLRIENINSEVSNFLTISGGLVSIIPTKNDTRDSIMKLADERLYKAKHLGRDRIVSTSLIT